MINDQNLIGHFKINGDKFKQMNFSEDSNLYRMTLIEKQTKLLITDYKRNQLHLLDLDGNILKSFNPNNDLKFPSDACVLSDLIDEKIFIVDITHHKIFVFNSDFSLKFQFGDLNFKNSNYMQIDNEFDKSRLYVSDHTNKIMK